MQNLARKTVSHCEITAFLAKFIDDFPMRTTKMFAKPMPVVDRGRVRSR